VTQAPQTEELLALASDLARWASAVHLERLGEPGDVDRKSASNDLVTDVDRQVEAHIAEVLGRERPGDGLLAEEGALREATSGVRWVVDPLDGTTNFTLGFPFFGCSIAVEVDGAPLLGVVSHSSLDRLYTGVKGGEARCESFRRGSESRNEDSGRGGGRRLEVRRRPKSLRSSVVATGFSYSRDQRKLQGAVAAKLLGQVADLRRSGSAALDLCQLAAGAVDAYYELDLSPWDYAAGSIIARAAGAEVELLEAAHGKGPAVVGAHPEVLPEFVAMLRDAGALKG
jgi:myo-inositol-1(or 4)-monophosphatase